MNIKILQSWKNKKHHKQAFLKSYCLSVPYLPISIRRRVMLRFRSKTFVESFFHLSVLICKVSNNHKVYNYTCHRFRIILLPKWRDVWCKFYILFFAFIEIKKTLEGLYSTFRPHTSSNLTILKSASNILSLSAIKHRILYIL